MRQVWRVSYWNVPFTFFVSYPSFHGCWKQCCSHVAFLGGAEGGVASCPGQFRSFSDAIRGEPQCQWSLLSMAVLHPSPTCVALSSTGLPYGGSEPQPFQKGLSLCCGGHCGRLCASRPTSALPHGPSWQSRNIKNNLFSLSPVIFSPHF